jgi:hypothetical protein
MYNLISVSAFFFFLLFFVGASSFGIRRLLNLKREFQQK